MRTKKVRYFCKDKPSLKFNVFVSVFCKTKADYKLLRFVVSHQFEGNFQYLAATREEPEIIRQYFC
jgi:hypothetical protein